MNFSEKLSSQHNSIFVLQLIPFRKQRSEKLPGEETKRRPAVSCFSGLRDIVYKSSCQSVIRNSDRTRSYAKQKQAIILRKRRRSHLSPPPNGTNYCPCSLCNIKHIIKNLYISSSHPIEHKEEAKLRIFKVELARLASFKPDQAYLFIEDICLHSNYGALRLKTPCENVSFEYYVSVSVAC
ncbi:hypothetical protein GQX74_009932 [Glossina fuscipes]|nr:hypothetical protein GQX74_009932 [Glossina fuscipes]